jgi:predicted dehydrogenase
MSVRVGLIGTGKIALANHLPGFRLCRDTEVTALCDPNASALEDAARVSGIRATWTDPFAMLREAAVDAVVIATPNRFHCDLAVAAAQSGRHVLCEKPLALTVAEAEDMLNAAERAGVRHMTAFTYRYVPAMRYLHHLVTSGALGTPWHFRAQRFQDWGRRALGWRQRQSDAGTGETGSTSLTT